VVKLRVMLDHNVPASVAEAFQSRGHHVSLVKDVLPVDSPDPLIATVCEEDGLILVSCDRDFDSIAPRIPKGMRARFRRLSRISLQCGEPQAAARVAAAMTLIEFEYETAQSLPDKRLTIVIQKQGMKTLR
jgi:predicted nuclease of predicted toxin-antitoxin system